MDKLVDYNFTDAHLGDVESGPEAIESLADLIDTIESLHLEELPDGERNEILCKMQGFLIDKLSDFNGLQGLGVIYDPSKSTWQFICDLLNEARENNKRGP